jgi:hypothetical protein
MNTKYYISRLVCSCWVSVRDAYGEIKKFSSKEDAIYEALNLSTEYRDVHRVHETTDKVIAHVGEEHNDGFSGDIYTNQ